MKSKAKNTITMGEWQAVMNQVAREDQPAPPGFQSIAELCDQWGVSLSTMRARMRLARTKGLVESIMLRRLTGSEKVRLVAYYRPKKAA